MKSSSEHLVHCPIKYMQLYFTQIASSNPKYKMGSNTKIQQKPFDTKSKAVCQQQPRFILHQGTEQKKYVQIIPDNRWTPRLQRCAFDAYNSHVNTSRASNLSKQKFSLM